MSNQESDLKKVIEVFQINKVRFLVIGARACAFHGYVRATEDIDILIQKDLENIENTILTIQEIYPHLEDKITPNDFYDNIVLKILDEPELDITLSAWNIEYEEALVDMQTFIMGGLKIPYLGIDSLIKSKSTSREQDIWDVKVLNEIKKSKK